MSDPRRFIEPVFRRLSLGGWALVCWGLTACASGKTAPSAPSGSFVEAPDADQPSSAPPGERAKELQFSGGEDEEPSVALDRAEAEVERALGGEGDYATPPTPAAPVTTDGAPGPVAKRPEVLGGDPCHTACRALASMRRAADRLCAISGDEPERCGDARGRVERAEERVSARCPACAE